MNRFILLTLILTSGYGHAVAFDCRSARDKQTEFLGYYKTGQNETAFQKSQKAYDLIHLFDGVAQNSPDRANQFACAVGLAAATLKWDEEGQTISYLSEKLMAAAAKKDTDLLKAYEAELKSFPNPCLALLLKDSITARTCMESLPEKHTAKEEDACEKKFSDKNHYRSCPERASESKKPKAKPATPDKAP